MQENKTANITDALKKIDSRFELIAVAARRARQIQNYEAAVAKAEANYRNTSTLVLAQARVKNAKTGTKESKVESQLRDLQSNPIQLFVDNTIAKNKPTVLALREIQAGYITKEFLDNQENLDRVNSNRNSYDEISRLINNNYLSSYANEHYLTDEEDDSFSTDFNMISAEDEMDIEED